MSTKKCSKCETAFECCNEQRGCWCESLTIAPETLKKLENTYDNCLCPNCLKDYSLKPIKN